MDLGSRSHGSRSHRPGISEPLAWDLGVMDLGVMDLGSRSHGPGISESWIWDLGAMDLEPCQGILESWIAII